MSLGAERPRPILLLAAFCEKVLQEQDGTLSLIRVVDQVNLGYVADRDIPAGAPLAYPPVNLSCVISIRAGEVTGKHSVRIRLRDPSGNYVDTHPIPVFFETEISGSNIVFPAVFNPTAQGQYWLEVQFDDDLVLTKIPLLVTAKRVEKEPTPSIVS